MRILAFGAHPDDVEFGAAPLLIKENQLKNQTKIVVCSLGEAGTSGTPAIRKKEAVAAAKVMGSQIEFLNLGGDCHIQYNPQNAIKIAKIIRQFKPEIVLAPSLTENQHPDHLNLARLTRDAARFARYGGLKELKKLPVHKITALYFYVSSAEWDRKPNILINVSDVKQNWEKTMAVHKSQMNTKKYIDIVLSKARALGASMGADLAVGLYVNDPIRVKNISDLNLSSRNY